MFNMGQIVTKENYTQAAIWCNANGAHIEKQDGQYVVAANAPAPEPPAQDAVVRLETNYGLPRAVRTSLLALREAGAALDEELMSRVEEIEALAQPLRTGTGETV